MNNPSATSIRNTHSPSVRPSDSPSVRPSDSPSVRPSNRPSVIGTDLNEGILNRLANDIETIDKLHDIVTELINLQNGLLNGESAFIPSYIKVKAKSWIPALDLKEIAVKLTQIFYLYNFVILKNDQYKKIVISFPGLSTYYQLIDEIYYEEMLDLPIKDEKQHYYVMTYYFNIFSEIEENLFSALEPLVNDEDYQVIFTGHSLGGAIATLASFYYIKKYKFTPESILITYGQPKVGSENFAKELTNIMKGQIYRIARPYDIATLFPIKEVDYFIKTYKFIEIAMEFAEFASKIASGNYYGTIKDAINFISNFDEAKEKMKSLVQYVTRDAADYYYSHTGGLYMINDDTNTVYHCDDFYNENREHSLCKNHHLKISFKVVSEIITNFKQNRNYLTLDQNIMSGCQKDQKLKIFKRIKLSSINWENIFFSRRLEVNDNINHNNDINENKNNTKEIRKLNNIEDISKLNLFEEINFNKNKSEFCFKYETKEVLKNNNLFLIINTKNKYFFAEICLSQNIAWLNNQEFEKINCYFANTLNPFSLKINLKKLIVNEKELYICFKGKTSGSLELYDLSKNKTLNISSSYIIPYVGDFNLENSLSFILPKIENDTYANMIIYDYDLVENLTNKTFSSRLKIYKNNDKINYHNNNIILEKNNQYYFKYYPDKYKIIINFIPIYLNKFLEKQFYIINKQYIHISYNIESISNNRSFGLFFDFNEAINIMGYFSSNINENLNSTNFYILNIYDKYFNLIKNIDRYKYFNLDIKLDSEFISELIIYDIQEVIIINKINSIYKINKTKNYLFMINETIKTKYEKVESLTVISINNDNNIIKLITKNNEIITSKNYLMTKINFIKGIFIKTNEDDIFMIKLMSEELYKYLNEESNSNLYNSFVDDKKYSIDFIHSNEDIFAFYNPISTDLKIYEINNGNYLQIDDLINNKFNYSLLLGMKSLEEQKTYMVLKISSSPFLYEKYINNPILDLNYRLYNSKICYLFMDFEFRFLYNIKIKKILMKVLNNDKNETIYFYCNNEIKKINNNIQILNVEKCNGTFHLLGNNNLIYFYLPLTVADSYNVIEKEDNFEFFDIYHFFFDF